jgi:hypothetical protein
MIKRRKPLKRSTKPIRRVSKVRRTRLTKYAEMRLQFLRDNLWCQVGNCKAPSTQCHHLRGRIGQRLNDFENVLAVCFLCHKKIHDNPKWARQNGYLR